MSSQLTESSKKANGDTHMLLSGKQVKGPDPQYIISDHTAKMIVILALLTILMIGVIASIIGARNRDWKTVGVSMFGIASVVKSLLSYQR